MPRYKRPYFRQKPILYFDENFPIQIIRDLRADGRFRKQYKILSVHEFQNQNRDDRFQYSFCRRNGFVLVTLDHDFMDDKKYPIQNIPGIVVISAGRNEIRKVKTCLHIITSFLSFFPLPKSFMGDTKFQVSLDRCIMRGRDSRTRQIKTMTILPGDTMSKVAGEFHYFG